MKPASDPVEYRENPVFMDLVSLLGNGFILSLFNIDFLFFEYLFPIVGSAIMLYGCHLIKEYSKEFQIAYDIALVRFFMMLLNFMLDWTSLNTNPYVAYLQIACSTMVIVFLFIYLDKAFSSMYKDAGVAPYRYSFTKYIFLYLGNVVSTFLTIQTGILGALISIVILLFNVLYVGLAFHRIGKDLTFTALEIEFSSYGKNTLRKHICFICGYILVLCIIIYLNNKGNLFIPHESGRGSNLTEEYNNTKANLVSLGMDPSIVEDLAITEYEYLKEAISITSQINRYTINGGYIKFTTYRIKLKDSERIIVYYKWMEEPSNRLFQILEYDIGSLRNVCELNSRCLYTDPEQHMTMEIASVENSLNHKANPYTDQKLSNTGESLRGFLAFSYSSVEVPAKEIADMKINFYYQVSIFNLPYLKIVDYMNYYEQYQNNIVYNRLTIPVTELFK